MRGFTASFGRQRENGGEELQYDGALAVEGVGRIGLLR